MKFLFFALIVLLSKNSFSKTLVIASTQDVASLVKEIGSEEVNVEFLSRGNQDPHFLEAKPSFIMKALKADLIVSIGLSLESAWLNNVLKGTRRPELQIGANRHFDLGKHIDVIEKSIGNVSRSDGDVHPEGNPHYFLDPIRIADVSIKLAEKLSTIEPAKSDYFLKNALQFKERMYSKTNEWKSRIQKSGIKNVITYHKTLNYFLDRFGIELTAMIEAKPGVPPTAKNLVSLLNTINDKKVKLILIENYFDTNADEFLHKKYPELKIIRIPVQVGGEAHIKTLEQLYENLVKTIEGQ